jgi:hypothetical protein
MVKVMGPLQIHGPLHGSQGAGPMYTDWTPPRIGPVLEDQDENIKLLYCFCTATIDHSEVTFFYIMIRWFTFKNKRPSARFIDYPEINVKLGKAVLIKIDILILRKSINVT